MMDQLDGWMTGQMDASAYLRLLIFLPAILIPACASSSPAFLMLYSAYKLKKQGVQMTQEESRIERPQQASQET